MTIPPKGVSPTTVVTPINSGSNLEKPRGFALDGNNTLEFFPHPGQNNPHGVKTPAGSGARAVLTLRNLGMPDDADSVLNGNPSKMFPTPRTAALAEAVRHTYKNESQIKFWWIKLPIITPQTNRNFRSTFRVLWGLSNMTGLTCGGYPHVCYRAPLDDPIYDPILKGLRRSIGHPSPEMLAHLINIQEKVDPNNECVWIQWVGEESLDSLHYGAYALIPKDDSGRTKTLKDGPTKAATHWVFTREDFNLPIILFSEHLQNPRDDCPKGASIRAVNGENGYICLLRTTPAQGAAKYLFTLPELHSVLKAAGLGGHAALPIKVGTTLDEKERVVDILFCPDVGQSLDRLNNILTFDSFIQLLKGLDNLHCMRVTLGDLGIRNVCARFDDNTKEYVISLIDFDTMSYLGESQKIPGTNINLSGPPERYYHRPAGQAHQGTVEAMVTHCSIDNESTESTGFADRAAETAPATDDSTFFEFFATGDEELNAEMIASGQKVRVDVNVRRMGDILNRTRAAYAKRVDQLGILRVLLSTCDEQDLIKRIDPKYYQYLKILIEQNGKMSLGGQVVSVESLNRCLKETEDVKLSDIFGLDGSSTYAANAIRTMEKSEFIKVIQTLRRELVLYNVKECTKDLEIDSMHANSSSAASDTPLANDPDNFMKSIRAPIAEILYFNNGGRELKLYYHDGKGNSRKIDQSEFGELYSEIMKLNLPNTMTTNAKRDEEFKNRVLDIFDKYRASLNEKGIFPTLQDLR